MIIGIKIKELKAFMDYAFRQGWYPVQSDSASQVWLTPLGIKITVKVIM